MIFIQAIFFFFFSVFPSGHLHFPVFVQAMLGYLTQPLMQQNREPDRPFKVYPHASVSLQGNYYPGPPMQAPYSTHSGMQIPFTTGTSMSSYSVTPTATQTPSCMMAQDMSTSSSSISKSGSSITDLSDATPSSAHALKVKSESSESGPLSVDDSSKGSSPLSLDNANNGHKPLEIDESACASTSGEGANGENGFKLPPKKRVNSVPDERKDIQYWEKRKKNNESAKRSRDARRMKEEQIAMRVVYLEQENLQLRTEVSLLKSEIEKLRCMLYNP